MSLSIQQVVLDLDMHRYYGVCNALWTVAFWCLALLFAVRTWRLAYADNIASKPLTNGFWFLGLLVLVTGRLPFLAMGQLNPDESQWLASAIDMHHSLGMYLQNFYVQDMTRIFTIFPIWILAMAGIVPDYALLKLIGVVCWYMAFAGFFTSASQFLGQRVSVLCSFTLLIFLATFYQDEYVAYNSETACMGLMGAFLCLNGPQFIFASRWRSFFSGAVLCAMVFAKEQSVFIAGSSWLFMALFFIWRKRAADFLALFLGGCVCLAIVLLPLIIYGTYQQLEELFYSWTQYSAHGLSTGSLSLYGKLQWLLSDADKAYFVWPPFLLLALLFWRSRRRAMLSCFQKRLPEIIWIAIYCFTSFYAVLMSPETFPHYDLFLALPSTFCLAIIIRTLDDSLSVNGRLLCGVFCATVIVIAVFRFASIDKIWRERVESLPPRISSFSRQILANTQKDDRMLVWGWDCRFYVETGLLRGSRYWATVFMNPDYPASFVAAAERNYVADIITYKPRVIVELLNGGGWVNYPNRPIAAPIGGRNCPAALQARLYTRCQTYLCIEVSRNVLTNAAAIVRKIPLTNISLLLIAFMVAIALSGSLHWGFQRDAALYLYTAFLMDRFDAVPYRDFFDANGPLTYWLYYILWKCVGTSNTLFRVADVLSLSLLGYAGWRILRCWSWGAATTGVLLWVLAYLELGPNQSMQREFFAMLFIAGSMNVYLSALPLLLRYGVASALVALAMMIKPVFALAYVAFLLVELIVEPGAGCGSTDASRIRSILLRTIFVRILATATGFIVVILPMAWLLKSKDAWDAFLDIAQHYWRLYMLVTPYAGAVAANDFLSLDTWQGVIRIITLHNAKLWFIPLVLAAKIAWQASPETSQRKRLVLLVVFCLLFAVYPFVTGKYSWPYHWIPFLYFACLLLGSGLFLTLESCRDNTRNRFTGGALTVLLAFEVLLLVDEDPLDWPLLLLYGTAILGLCWWGKRYVMWQSWLPHACVVCMVWVFVGHIRESDYLRPVLSGHYVQRPADDGRVDVIARFLRQHMQPGDEVQNIDWVKGALHAMLLVQARMPTRFMVDLQFRHHADQEYTRQLRQEFIAGLQASMPRFVVSVPTVLQGTEAFNTFPELDAYLTQNYFVVFTDSRFSLQIFERQEGRPHSPQHKNRRNPPLGTRLPDSGS